MSTFEDDYLERAEMMPLATAGELKMWNLRVLSLDLDKMTEDRWVFIGWKVAYELAIRFLDKMGMSVEDIRKTLALSTGDVREVPETLLLGTRHRLYDVHRMHIAILILYPEQPENQRLWFTARHQNLENRSPIEIMASEGTEKIRRLLEGRLSM